MSYDDSMFVLEVSDPDNQNAECEVIELYPGSAGRKLTRENSEEYIALTTQSHLSLAKD